MVIEASSAWTDSASDRIVQAAAAAWSWQALRNWVDAQ